MRRDMLTRKESTQLKPQLVLPMLQHPNVALWCTVVSIAAARHATIPSTFGFVDRDKIAMTFGQLCHSAHACTERGARQVRNPARPHQRMHTCTNPSTHMHQPAPAPVRAHTNEARGSAAAKKLPWRRPALVALLSDASSGKQGCPARTANTAISKPARILAPRSSVPEDCSKSWLARQRLRQVEE